MKYQIFLGKSGKITGPFNDDEISKMRSNGTIATYTWLWDTRSPGWNTLDPPPPPPAGVDVPIAPLAGIAPLMQLIPSVKEIPDPVSIEAMCYDFRNVLAGKLCHVSEVGCELVGGDHRPLPVFSSNASVYLNLLDTDGGRGMSVVALLTDVKRQNGQWHYQLRWSHCPEILR